MADENEIEAEVNEEQDVAEEEEEAEVDSEDEDDEPKKTGKTGNKARELWEKDMVYQRTARRAKYAVVVNLQDEKDKALREQAKSLYIPLEEAERMIMFLKSLPEPEEEKAKNKLAKRLEGMRRSREILHGRL